MIDVGPDELKNSFYVHSEAAKNGNSSSHFLLLFYAVECGLKARILRENDLKKISERKKELKDHNLPALARKIQLPMGEISFHLDNGGKHSIEEAHQAWRYGSLIHQGDEHKIIEWLKKVQEKIRRRIK